jgi:hypothetical protein
LSKAGVGKRVKLTKITVYNIADRQPIEHDAKECTKCRLLRKLSDFHASKTGLAGRMSHCIDCERDRHERRQTTMGKKCKPRGLWRKRKKIINIRGVKLKECLDCGSVRPLEDYRARKGRGVYPYCMKCSTKRDREWRTINPEGARMHTHLRRALKRGLPHTLTPETYSTTLQRFSNTCAILETSVKLSAEHFIALSVGHGGTTAENVYPMEQSLNSTKWRHNPFDWILTRPDIDANRFAAVVAYLADLNGLTLDEYRQLVDWCYANPRTIDEIKADNKRYGYVVSSLELWREATGIAFPIRIDFGNGRELSECAAS